MSETTMQEEFSKRYVERMGTVFADAERRAILAETERDFYKQEVERLGRELHELQAEVERIVTEKRE